MNRNFFLPTIYLLFSIFCCTQVQAFPTTLHYSVATEIQEHALDSYSNWDSEAASDFVTYQLPLDWDLQWWRNSKSFDLSVGSISSKHFLSYKRIKLHQKLTDRLEVHLKYLEMRDFEQDRVLLPLELKYFIGEKFAVSIFGMPSLYKAEDDIGGSVFYEHSSSLTFRLSYVLGDFQRNERNIQSDRWTTSPSAYTLSATYRPDEQTKYLNAELHFEPRSVRVDSNQSSRTDLSYSALLVSGHQGRLLYDQAYGSQNGRVIARKRFLHQLEHAVWLGSHRVRPGINLFYRQNKIDDRQIINRELMPTLWVDGPVRAKSWGQQTLSVGVDSTVFNREEASELSNSWQNRLNVKVDMKFKHAGQLALLFTADLDQLGSSETWEGGAGQFRMDF